MCGRYTLALPAVQVQDRFEIQVDESVYRPRYNAAPGQLLPIITGQTPNVLTYCKWGLVPHWAKDPRIGYKMINARAETVAEKPAYKSLFKHQRCLVIADGFYEWQQVDKKVKHPYRIQLSNGKAYAMAGLWSSWKDAEGKSLHSFTIITVPANPLVANIHDRMPAILPKPHERWWIAEDVNPSDLQELLQPYPAEEMMAYPVSDRVNKATEEDPDLLQPIDTGTQGTLF